MKDLTLKELKQLPNFSAFDRYFRASAELYLPRAYPWVWTKGQAIQESRLDPHAENPRSGALGIMQLMPGTDRWIDQDLDGTDPAGNIDNGTALMAYLMGAPTTVTLQNGRPRILGRYRGFVDIPDLRERWRFALAGYNAGWGHIAGPKVPNARQLAREAGKNDGRWKSVAPFLRQVTGANAKETLDYVASIDHFAHLLEADNEEALVS